MPGHAQVNLHSGSSSTFAQPVKGFRFPKEFQARIEEFPARRRKAGKSSRRKAR